MMKIGCLQIKVESNIVLQIAKVKDQIKSLSKKGVHLIVVPELFLHPYFCQNKQKKHFEIALESSSKIIENFQTLSKECKIFLVFSYFEKAKDHYFNTAIMIDFNGKIQGKYRKNHIPYDQYFYEKYYFEKGNLDYPIFDTPWGKIGILICFDQWFPEAARSLALQGCSIVVCPTAIGWDINEIKTVPNVEKLHQKELEAWTIMQRSHAIANGFFWVSVNRVGTEENLSFWGNSFVCDPFGEILNETHQKEGMIIVEINLNAVKKTRKIWTFLRDRRTDTYSLL